MADDTDKSDYTDDEGKSGNETPFGSKSKHHKGKAKVLKWDLKLERYQKYFK